MKILVFSNFPPFVMGGAENQVARLVKAWLDMGHTVEVAGYGIPNQKVNVGKHAVRLHHLRVFKAAGRPGRGLTYFLSLLFFAFLQRKKFDVIYARGLGEAAIAVCIAKMLKLCNLPFVACPINARGRGDMNFMTSLPGGQHLIKLINRHCNGVNIIARAIKDDLEETGIAVASLAQTPNGIPILPLDRADREPGPRRLLFTGRLSAQKGLDLLISALCEMRQEGFEFECDIIGDGPLKTELQEQIDEASRADCIRLRGPVDGTNIRRLLLQADVFVMPSRYEGMSNSVLEAMEAGLPVLVTQCGGIDHYIAAANGWTCPPNEQHALADSLRRMLLTPYVILQSMGKANREIVEQQFAIEKVAQANIDFFNNVRKQCRRL